MVNSDISVEPLLNRSTEGIGADKRLAVVPVNEVGAASNRAAATVTDTAEGITIGTGKRTIEIQNSGANTIYYGGSGVDDTDGIAIFRDYIKVFANVKSDFIVYIASAAGANSARKIVEYE